MKRLISLFITAALAMAMVPGVALGAVASKSTTPSVGAVSSASAKLYGHDDVHFTWSKKAGVTGYAVYFKKASSGTYTLIMRTTGTGVKKANLADGVKYNFKVVPYKTINGTRHYGTAKVASVYTLKKVSKPTVAKYSSTKVKVKWTNVSGESGYQISKSTSKTGTNIVSTYATTTGNYKTLTATKGKTYYYKVRAYKTVGSKKVYGPWSSATSYKLSSSSSSSSSTAITSTVYVTNTGAKFHRDGCSSLRSSKIAMSRSSALSQGYEPCKICRP